MFRIGSDGSQGLGGSPKQDAVDDRFVLVSDGSDLFGDGEDDMEIVCGKNFGRSLLDPDRKSIRLNSSHLGISYAVFCLKKKNKQRPSLAPTPAPGRVDPWRRA